MILDGKGPWRWASIDGRHALLVERTNLVWRVTHDINGAATMIMSAPSTPCPKRTEQEVNLLIERIEAGVYTCPAL